ncbi:hypothetical protein [Pseudolactococcus carnosus]|uniref:hypothetical protein n=1 Tax=Pseudolactococcus carnosus TaxID=2749961 RepID=UPI0008126B3E|nr:hypothetical protein [Lactococcus carnosus]SCA92912.1 conserved hypothetical protein [Lactococcus piscium]MCJ1969103.1 hypothetical protein [Lactococcus carnosus]MCJ1974991.1 hypothetical protein [Lactococcus carnosus]MCJ1985236.1 hypothetical protein [Lactococcus carnosus]MCJ1986630.1 hypothetical protein [Lactococcus carnosus]
MSKYEPLWQIIAKDSRLAFKLTFEEIEAILGFPIDHAFLTYKKELKAHGYEVGKISMKEKHVNFKKMS